LFFLEISPKNLHCIWDKTRQILGKTDEFSNKKKIKQFQVKRTFLSTLTMMNKNLLPILWEKIGAQISAKTQ